MAFYPQPNTPQQNSPDEFGYDLETEKRIIAQGIEEIKKELLEEWKRKNAHAQIFPDNLSSINPELIGFILSFQNTIFYDNLAKKYNLNKEQRNDLPQIVWHVCINKAWDKIENLIQEHLNIPKFREISQEINQNILSKAKELSEKNFQRQRLSAQEESQPRTIVTSFSQALKNFPEIGEQLVTSSRIKLKNFPEPVRPSIKNWLSDYTFNLGYDPHSAMVRANFVFKNNNARTLNEKDRQKLSFILKSYDENAAVSVNTSTKQILFPATSVRQPTPQPSSFAPRQVTGKYSQDNSEPKDIFERESFATEKKSFDAKPKNQSASPQKMIPSFSKPDNFSTPPPTKNPLTNNLSRKNSNQLDEKLRFSSPQKMPFESENEQIEKTPSTPQPMRINPQGFKRDFDEDYEREKKVPPGNIVNLKE